MRRSPRETRSKLGVGGGGGARDSHMQGAGRQDSSPGRKSRNFTGGGCPRHSAPAGRTCFSDPDSESKQVFTKYHTVRMILSGLGGQGGPNTEVYRITAHSWSPRGLSQQQGFLWQPRPASNLYLCDWENRHGN